MASTDFVVTFKGDVLKLYADLGNHDVPMIPTNNDWSGKLTIDVSGDAIRFTMRFYAVPGTNWQVSVDTTTNLLSAKGTSSKALVSYSQLVPLKAAAAPAKGQQRV